VRLIGNILWFVLGGFFVGLAWFFCGILAYCSIIGIPWGKACFVLGEFALFPFGRVAVSRRDLTHQDDIGTGFLGLVGNIIWFVFAGFWLAAWHLVMAVAFFCTIIGIPFGLQHLKMIEIALFPIGKTIVPAGAAEQVRKATAPE
jgi:uncharacterized membrane protein YccF (DUF307 family)